MPDYSGWLLDVYPDPEDGLVLWLLDESGARLRLRQSFPVTFYAAGAFPRLRALWRFLESRPVVLSRAARQDLFVGEVPVLAIRVGNPVAQTALFHEVVRAFPDLDYYDADLPLPLRAAAVYGLFPLARCTIAADQDGWIQQLAVHDQPWEINPPPPPLRTLRLFPDENPARRTVTRLFARIDRSEYRLPMAPDLLLIQLGALLRRHDPDLLLTDWGDTWLFPWLLAYCRKHQLTHFNPNRDTSRPPLQRAANSYFSYGQVVYRGAQTHLFGRWHIDTQNAMMFGEYGLAGVLEQARVTGLPVQEIARKSPGAGITAMQMVTALREGVLVPYQKQQAETPKTARQLMRADRGGLVFQPVVGLHENVAELDFTSMYPGIMVRFNLSPETVGNVGDTTITIPALGVPVDQTRAGLIPKTLRPLLAKRLRLKARLAALDPRDTRCPQLSARAKALRWLLVVCFGYLGYKNARFGRIEAHEAVTAFGREIMMQAKEIAEEAGCRVLHLYVDGLWVQPMGAVTPAGALSPRDIAPLLARISQETGIGLALEGVYRWIAFLPSRQDARVPVSNRYFGVFQDGTIKVRGLAAQRHDTPLWLVEVQMEILHTLAQARTISEFPRLLPEIVHGLRFHLTRLRQGDVPLEKLVISQTLGRTLAAYRVRSPAARAGGQLEEAGKPLHPGQRVRYVFTRGQPGVHAWDLPAAPSLALLDYARYQMLFLRAAHMLLQPLGVAETTLRDWLLAGAGYGASIGVVTPHAASPLFAPIATRKPGPGMGTENKPDLRAGTFYG